MCIIERKRETQANREKAEYIESEREPEKEGGKERPEERDLQERHLYTDR